MLIKWLGLISLAFFVGLLVIFVGPEYSFAFILFLLAAYAFIFHFKKMFVFFIIVRPMLDIFQGFGVNIGYSNINPAAALSFLFIVGGFVHFAISKKSIFICREIKLYAFFLFFALFGTLYNLHIVGTEGLFGWSRLLVVFVVMAVILQEYRDRASLIKLMKYILFSAVLPAIIGVVQIFTGINLPGGSEFQRLTGSFSHSNVFAPYLFLIIVMLFCVLCIPNQLVNNKYKKYLWPFLGLLCTLMFLTYSRGSWIAMVIALFFIGILHFRKKTIVFSGIAILVLLVSFSITGRIPVIDEVMRRFEDIEQVTTVANSYQLVSSWHWRLIYWEELLFELMNSPIIGFGLGSVISSGSAELEAHNNYIQVFFETGVGGLFYFAMIFLFIAHAFRGSYSERQDIKAFSAGVLGIFLAYLVNSMSGHLIRFSVFQIYFLSLPLIMKNLDNSIESEKK